MVYLILFKFFILEISNIKSDSFLNFLFEDNILMEKQILNNKNFLVDYLKNKNISNNFGQILFRLLSKK